MSAIVLEYSRFKFVFRDGFSGNSPRSQAPLGNASAEAPPRPSVGGIQKNKSGRRDEPELQWTRSQAELGNDMRKSRAEVSYMSAPTIAALSSVATNPTNSARPPSRARSWWRSGAI